MKLPVDWRAILTELHSHRVGCKSVAMDTGLNERTVSLYKRGVMQPNYERGEGIIDIWMHKTGKAYEQLPRVQQ